MNAAQILALMLTVGPQPGMSPYSVVEVAKDAPAPCQREHDPRCRKPWWAPERQAFVRQETEEEALGRYLTIAEAIAAQPGSGLQRDLLTVTLHESSWRRDIHEGIGALAIGDAGRSYCLGQMLLGLGAKKGYALVGTSPKRTRRCIGAVAKHLARARKGCGGSDLCTFGAYGGVKDPAGHPGIVARAATRRRFAASPKLAPSIRAALGLPAEDGAQR
jgi:hypothetical protein